ncbi:MAG TPA: hypothetical protein VLN56_04395, partial [Gammaproteobacteria bacterium]|nr:hypothetical protein [Gammaproteobacteria bacterium]
IFFFTLTQTLFPQGRGFFCFSSLRGETEAGLIKSLSQPKTLHAKDVFVPPPLRGRIEAGVVKSFSTFNLFLISCSL